MHLNASQFLRTDTSFVEDEKKKLGKDDQNFKVCVIFLVHFYGEFEYSTVIRMYVTRLVVFICI